MTGFDALRRNARRVPKAAFWLMTPWRMPERLRFLRERAASQEREQLLGGLIERERARLEALAQGNVAAGMPALLDLCSDAALSEAAGTPTASVVGSSVDPGAVTDTWTAARFCMSLLRGRKDLYARFPYALSETADKNAFLVWLQSDDGAQDTGLTPVSQAHVAGLFSGDFAARARQAFMAEPRIRQVLPHGLTPAGRHSLLGWFMQHVWSEAEAHLRREEILWLFMQAAENPRAELARAYLFTPDWQQQFPDALTVFGWSAFASWFARHYGADPQWVGVDAAPEWYEPALQVRLGYGAQAAWQARHPQALSDPGQALALLEWMASAEEAGLSAEARRWCQALDARAVASALLTPGVNIIGHFCYPSGLRVSVESIAEALGQVGLDTSLRDLRTDAKDDPHHVDFDGLEVYDVTVIHTQPEPFFPEAYARADLAERSPRTYRIAYWYWEFDSIPDAWVESAKQVDEVWTATEFIARGLRERLSVPVRTLFPGVRLTPFEVRKRSDFGLDEGRYTFLFTFHMMSVMERKNPLGLIRAFRAAFREDEKVSLVLKTSFGDRHPAELQKLRDAAAGANITVIDQVFSPDEVLSLMNACDAYVSLHRSEGLGLTMAEAMLMGKPVIATNFSGNVDFMDDGNSLLVPYELVKLGKPIPPYDADLEWAEPSVEHAARLMRRLYDDQVWARGLGARAKASAEANLSLEAAGRRIKARLEEIDVLRRTRR
ncbi:glycosyltransferase family 4 protein [Variovorax sp. YR266]|uniref:glycosyltransferase family 4 protein n=1 Tax=Variovorax sp. YR266 TaxID=1884386 RepID=UPI000B821B67|nr:glycosyltransferase family 4 protein [Variovorax sp. YR266]